MYCMLTRDKNVHIYTQPETQLSLTNRETHFCKCNDVADLTSVIKIRLIKTDTSTRPFKVTQGHWNRHGSICHL